MVDALEATESLDKFRSLQTVRWGNEVASVAACGVIFPVSSEGVPQEARCGLDPKPALVDLAMHEG